MNTELDTLLIRYGSLLREVDQWFDECRRHHGDLISCHHGCSHCCRGLFDITILDALYLRSGFDLLPEEVQQGIRSKSVARLDPIAARWPAFVAPWLLNPVPEEEWDEIMPEEDEAPCVMLSAGGVCTVYEHRPMTCRLNGIPMIDVSGEELFDDWCTMNFVGVDPLELKGLRHSFNDLFAQELLLFRELTWRMYGEIRNELDTIIPAAALVDREMLQRVDLSAIT